MLEPSMGKYAMQSAENVDEILNPNVFTVIVIMNNKTAREDLLISYDICGPVQGVAAVVDSTATLGLLMYSA
jgi:hypothetical protein